jgi:uncharacterized protein YijF (DUF1287 family)
MTLREYYLITGLCLLYKVLYPQTVDIQVDLYSRLSEAALDLTKQHVVYDPNYYVIDYPNGDVPAGNGVCTDVIIRAYRKLSIDLQREVHEDITVNISLYPQKWGLKKPDTNIDHRRVPNLMTFFSRMGEMKPITDKAADYVPGDIVCWDLGGGITHIGLVVDKKSDDGKRCQVVHNIGAGQVLADCLFEFTIIGHYRYCGLQE